MRALRTRKFFFRSIRSAVGAFAVAGLFSVCASTASWAQHAGEGVRSRFMERIDQEEGVKRMAAFRRQRLEGDYCFRFRLEHLPRRGKKEVYSGIMWGSWNESGPVTRFKLFSDGSAKGDGDGAGGVELIVQNGAQARAWIREGASEEFKLISGEALFEPIVPGVVYTPFDLQMPFIYWDDFVYEGPARVQSRIAQQFLMSPPEAARLADPRIGSVRIGLDDAYDALLRIEVLNDAGDELSRFTVESFKKVQGQYIVKEITLKDNETRARTRFKVEAASVGLMLDPLIFDACRAVGPPKFPESAFKTL